MEIFINTDQNIEIIYVTFSKGKSETHSCFRFQKKKKKKEKEGKTFKDHEYQTTIACLYKACLSSPLLLFFSSLS